MVRYNPQSSDPIIIYNHKNIIFVYLPSQFFNETQYLLNGTQAINPIQLYVGPHQDRIVYFNKTNWGSSFSLRIGSVDLNIVDQENPIFLKNYDSDIDLSFNDIIVPVFQSYFQNHSSYNNLDFTYLRNYTSSIYNSYLFYSESLQIPFELRDIQFIECDFSNTNFKDSSIIDCSFVKCKFIDSQFQNSDVSGCRFLRCYLQNSNWSNGKLRSTDFLICNMNNMIFPSEVSDIGSGANFGNIQTQTWVLSSGILAGPGDVSIRILDNESISEITQTDNEINEILPDLELGWFILNRYLKYDINYKLKLNFLGRGLNKISETQTFELGQNFYLDPNHLLDLSASNLTLSSPLFYSRNSNQNHFYFLNQDQLFNLDISFNSTGLFITQQGDRIQKFTNGKYGQNDYSAKEYNFSDRFVEAIDIPKSQFQFDHPLLYTSTETSERIPYFVENIGTSELNVGPSFTQQFKLDYKSYLTNVDIYIKNYNSDIIGITFKIFNQNDEEIITPIIFNLMSNDFYNFVPLFIPNVLINSNEIYKISVSSYSYYNRIENLHVITSNQILIPNSFSASTQVTASYRLGLEKPNFIHEYTDNVYTVLDSQNIIQIENNQFTTKNNQTYNFQGSLLYDYNKSIYYLDQNTEMKKLNTNQMISTIDISSTPFITIPIDSDESIQISVNRAQKIFFSSFIYNEILFAEKTLRFSDFYVYDKKDCFSTLSLDGNQMLFIDFTTKLLYFFTRNIENEFELQNSFTPDLSVRKYLNLDDKINTMRVDWKNQWIYFGLGGMNPNSKGKVVICSWNISQSEYKLIQVVSSVFDPSGYSFGTSIDISIFGEVIAIGEPNANPEGNYKRGRIHMYRKEGQRIVWVNELRSEDSPIGFIIKLSPTENELATFGTTINPNETMKLVLFRSIFLPTARSISFPYVVEDFEFFGKEVIMTANEVINNQSIFHWIQKVNRCFEIVTTRDLTHESIVRDFSDRFDIYSIKNEYVLMVRKKADVANEYYESSIELYHVEDDLEQLAVIDLENNKVKLFGNITSSYDGSTMGYQSYQNGKFDFYFYF
jgi:uncharacterized protein YjbI with pentapeptide repeats